MKTIPISGGQIALVDDEDFEMLAGFKWTAQKRKRGFHAARYVGKKYVYMHRTILAAPARIEVDHRDGNGLNNQRYNLRLATKSQNGMAFRHLKGKSEYRGVSWHAGAQKWTAKVQANGKEYYLGLFQSPEDAARTRDVAATQYHGPFATLNFPK